MEKQNYIIGVVIIIIFLVGLVLFSKENSTDAGNDVVYNGELSASEMNWDFGTVSMAAGKVSHTFQIKNSSSEKAVIKKIETSCMCTSATLLINEKRLGPFGMPGHGFSPTLKEVLDSNAEAGVEVLFDPTAHGPAGVGPIERTISIETGSGKKLTLDIKVMVTP